MNTITRLCFALIVVGIALPFYVFAAAPAYCTDACYAQDFNQFSTAIFYTGNTQINTQSTQETFNALLSDGKYSDFTVSYDSAHEMITVSIDGQVMTKQYIVSQDIDYIVLRAITSYYGGNSIALTQLTLNGQSIDALSAEYGETLLKIMINDNDFLLQGKMLINAQENTNGELPAFYVYANSITKKKSHSINIASLNAAVPAVVTGFIFYPNGTGVNGASVDATCEHLGVNSTLSVTSNEDGSYFAVFSGGDCSSGDWAYVFATFGELSGQGSGKVCQDENCPIPVALINVTIPEFTVVGAMIVVLAGLGLVVYRRNK